MDKRNLIHGKLPEIGNVDHIIEYKRRALIQGGELPVPGVYIHYDYTIRRHVKRFICPKCSSWIDFDNTMEETTCCYTCDNDFEIRASDQKVYVLQSNINPTM